MVCAFFTTSSHGFVSCDDMLIVWLKGGVIVVLFSTILGIWIFFGEGRCYFVLFLCYFGVVGHVKFCIFHALYTIQHNTLIQFNNQVLIGRSIALPLLGVG